MLLSEVRDRVDVLNAVVTLRDRGRRVMEEGINNCNRNQMLHGISQQYLIRRYCGAHHSFCSALFGTSATAGCSWKLQAWLDDNSSILFMWQMTDLSIRAQDRQAWASNIDIKPSLDYFQSIWTFSLSFPLHKNIIKTSTYRKKCEDSSTELLLTMKKTIQMLVIHAFLSLQADLHLPIKPQNWCVNCLRETGSHA